jgi:hypothetical protein
MPTLGDNFIITPATPLPSPQNNKQATADQDEQDEDPMDTFPLERKCSVYRNRKLESNEENYYNATTINVTDVDEMNLQPPLYPGQIPNGIPHPHWADEYCDSEHRTLGVCTCDHIEVINIKIFK